MSKPSKKYSGVRKSGRIRRAWWQRMLLWIAWIATAVVIYSDADSSTLTLHDVGMLIVSVGLTFACNRWPAGRAVFDVVDERGLEGEFVCPIDWAAVAIGALVALAGLAMSIRVCMRLLNHQIGFSDLVADTLQFIWYVNRTYVDVTHHSEIYVMALLLPLGVWWVGVNLRPLLAGYVRYRIGSHGIEFQRAASWSRLDFGGCSRVVADRSKVECTLAGGEIIRLPLADTVSVEMGSEVQPALLGAWFREQASASGLRVSGDDPLRWEAVKA